MNRPQQLERPKGELVTYWAPAQYLMVTRNKIVSYDDWCSDEAARLRAAGRKVRVVRFNGKCCVMEDEK